jgi:CRP/FNR family transcriptional regulator, transcriptional activator FtrB
MCYGAFMTELSGETFAGELAADPPTLLRLTGRDRAALPIFKGIDEHLARTLLDASSARQYRAGSIIVRQSDPVEGLLIVRSGLVDLTRIDGQHECGVLLLSARDLLLPAASLFGELSLVTARALTTTRMLVIPNNVAAAALAQSPAFSANLMKAMSGQWRMAVRNILDLNCRTAGQRLGAFLLRLVDLQSDSPSAVLPIAKRHLASRLGMSAETLSRMLQVVADHGLHLRGRTIIVRDREQIEEFCGPDPYPERDERDLDVFAL